MFLCCTNNSLFREVAGEREGWIDPNEGCAGNRKVPELLAEQIEDADILLLNKIDLAEQKQIEVAEALARSINKNAILEKVEFGKTISPTQIIRDDKFKEENKAEEMKSECCSDPGCSSRAAAIAKAEAEESLEEEDSHDHSHNHSHGHTHDMHTDNLGIISFVYKSSRAFDTKKLMQTLHTWPVPIKESLEGLEHFKPDSAKDDSEPAGCDSPFFGVLRSKGFCWLAPMELETFEEGQWRHETVMYWSHAGKHFGITSAGKWWATRSKSELKEYFKHDHKEYERIIKQDFVTEQWGDRRQELVFIGANIDEERITKALDDCLLDDRGMEIYSSQVKAIQAENYLSEGGNF